MKTVTTLALIALTLGACQKTDVQDTKDSSKSAGPISETPGSTSTAQLQPPPLDRRIHVSIKDLDSTPQNDFDVNVTFKFSNWPDTMQSYKRNSDSATGIRYFIDVPDTVNATAAIVNGTTIPFGTKPQSYKKVRLASGDTASAKYEDSPGHGGSGFRSFWLVVDED